MNIVDRVKNICLSPNTEWSVIEAENTPTGTLVTGYVIPLAAIAAVAGFVGGSLIGRQLPFLGFYRVPFATGLTMAIVQVAMAVLGVFVISFIINALAPNFGAQKDSAQAMKVAVYSFTPAWVAGVLNILPMLGVLAILGGLYGLYLMYLGLPRLMKAPQDRAVGYTVVVVVVSIVVMFILSIVTGTIVGTGAMMSGGLMGGGTTASSGVEFDPDSPMGRLENFGREMEQSAAKMEQAQQSGDAGAQMTAAMEALGTMFGGGRRVDPVAIERLAAFVPESFAGLPKTSSNSERTGIASLMVSKSEATYGDGNRSVQLEIVDSGGASGIVGLASWVGVEGVRDNAQETERT
ncbi:MAG: Yip1 family protein, partial [Vicinamibacterales bacterium]